MKKIQVGRYLKPELRICNINPEMGFATSYGSSQTEDPLAPGDKTDW